MPAQTFCIEVMTMTKATMQMKVIQENIPNGSDRAKEPVGGSPQKSMEYGQVKEERSV